MGKNLNPWAWAITSGVLWGATVGITALLVCFKLKFFCFNKDSLDILSAFYPGLKATVPGAAIGFLQGFVCGGLFGWLFAFIHNCVLNILHRNSNQQ